MNEFKEIRIVPARREDLAAIVAISNHAATHAPANFATAPEPLAQWMKSWEETAEAYPWLAARLGDGVIAFARSGPHRARGAYAWTAELSVYVHPEHHRQGLGRALYQRMIPLLRAQGYVTLLAGITRPNPASERLHESFGFRRCATFHRVGWKFGRWRDVGYWELALQPEEHTPGPLRKVESVLP
ncbi:MAG: N-acetyltransferase family protein [Myxococcales bacterium]|nr:N-acetyltransferase family protein [Myxococcales bacterium]